jgi:hypothetical protein
MMTVRIEYGRIARGDVVDGAGCSGAGKREAQIDGGFQLLDAQAQQTSKAALGRRVGELAVWMKVYRRSGQRREL